MADDQVTRELYSRELVGASIRVLRKQRRLSQAELARLAKVDRPALAMYERGERWAKFNSYDRLLRAMNVEWDEFGAVLKAQLRKIERTEGAALFIGAMIVAAFATGQWVT